MNKRQALLISIGLLLNGLYSCHTAKSKAIQQPTHLSYAQQFNAAFTLENEVLLLSCITYAEEKANHLLMDSINGFYNISHELLVYTSCISCNNIDSSIDAYINNHKQINFTSQEAQQRILVIKRSYNIIADIVFGDINDDDEEKNKLLENKIISIPALSKIYRSYVSADRDPSSLSSSEGSALLIHLSYYLSKQDEQKRNAILKQLL
jgi:hypothetical protein